MVLYACETLSMTLRQECRLRVSENRVLRIFGLKRDEVMGGWGNLHNEELHRLYSSPRIIRMTKLRNRWAGHRGMHIGILVRKPEGKRSLGRPRHKWEYGIKIEK
jgi:hypothetical protein